MEYKESRLLFKFEEKHWSVVKYDNEHFYREKIHKAIPKTKSVDFIGIYNGQALVFFEIKNYRKNSKEESTKKILQYNAENLCLKIAKKVRDTVPGIIGANRNINFDGDFWEKSKNLLANSKFDVIIIAWIEEDNLPNRDSRTEKVKLSTRKSKLKQKLNWLTQKVFFHNINNAPDFSGFSCEFISGS